MEYERNVADPDSVAFFETLATKDQLIVDEGTIPAVHVLDVMPISFQQQLSVVSAHGASINDNVAVGMPAEDISFLRQRMPLTGGVTVFSRQKGHWPNGSREVSGETGQTSILRLPINQRQPSRYQRTCSVFFGFVRWDFCRPTVHSTLIYGKNSSPLGA